jgi:RNA polymerase sigma factor (sigma-70 family)
MKSTFNASGASDEELIREIRSSKSPKLFETIYQRYSKKVFNKCLSFTHDDKQAEDLVHDIFLKTYIKLGTFDFNAKFSTWVYAITYNTCVDFIKGEARRKEVPIAENLDLYDYLNDESDDDKLFEIKVDQLKVLLELIPKEDKVLLLLKYQDGASIAELMEVTGLQESAIKMRLKRSKAKLVKLSNERYKNLMVGL